MNVSLLIALRTVVRADSDLTRQALFRKLMQSHRSVRIAVLVHERTKGTSISAALLAAFGFATMVRATSPRRADVLVVARHANARHQTERVCRWITGMTSADIAAGGIGALVRSGLDSVAGLLSVRAVRRAMKLLRQLERRYSFLLTYRGVAAVAWYVRGKRILRRRRPAAVLVSSDTNPEEAGVLGAARELGIACIFVSHAYPTALSPRLDFTLSLLEGEAALAERRKKGCESGEVILSGVEGTSAPLDVERLRRPRPVIGVFPAKALSWETLASTLRECLELYDCRRILIRWHPSMVEHPKAAHIAKFKRVKQTRRALTLEEVVRDCDWVVADENSNVHLQVLKMGVPTVAIRHLGVYPDSRSDQYGFAAHGIVFPPVQSLREIDLNQVAAFYSSGWTERFTHYDAAYLRPEEEIAADVRQAVARIVGAAGPRHVARL